MRKDNDKVWDELLAEIEKLAASVGLAHPVGGGLGFSWVQTDMINRIIELGVKTGDFGETKREG